MASRVYANPPPPGPIETALTGRTRTERMTTRTAEHMALPLARQGFALDGYVITITGAPRPFADGRGIEIDVSARDRRGPLLVDNPYRFVNPPVKVGNATWRVLPDSTEVENTEENPAGAFKRMVLDAVLLRAKQLGWTP